MAERALISDEKNGLIIGRNPVLEALRAEFPIDKLVIAKGKADGSLIPILALARERGVVVAEVPRAHLDELCGSKKHQGAAAFAAAKEYCALSDILDYAKSRGELPFVLLADGLSDPHNLGAIIRTAEAAGAHGVIIPKRRSAWLSFAAAKAAAGALFHMKVAKVANLSMTISELKRNGFWIFGADGKGGVLYTDADFRGIPLAFVIGGEGEGISRLVLERCDAVLRIPMLGKIDSLNASAATAVLLYEAVRQRNKTSV